MGVPGFDAALDVLPVAVTVQDAEGGLVYANQAASELSGYATPAEMLAAGGAATMASWAVSRADGSPLSADELPGRRILAGEDPEPLVLRSVHRVTGRLSWTRITSAPVADRDGSLAYVVNAIADITETKLLEIRQRVLARAGALLSEAPDVERALAQVAGLAVPDLAEWCALEVADGTGGVRLVALEHADPAKQERALEIRRRYPPEITAERGVGRALAGHTEHYPEIPEELLVQTARDAEHLAALQEIRIRSAIVVPVRASDEVLGALTLVDGTRSFSEADVSLAEDLGRRAGGALARVRLFQERSDVARTLETALLPSALPEVQDWDIATHFAPAPGAPVGGDFYDLFFVRGGWCLVVGDVAGRGTAAAALTSMIRYTMRATVQVTDDLAAAAGQVNELLREQHSDTALCTLAAMRVGDDGRTEVLCAGHPLPALVRDGDVSWVGHPGPILGGFADSAWTTDTPHTEPGDSFVLYTDGVLESQGAADRFGTDRLCEALRQAEPHAASDLVTAVTQAVSDHAGRPQTDDIAVVCARRLR